MEAEGRPGWGSEQWKTAPRSWPDPRAEAKLPTEVKEGLELCWLVLAQ